MQQQLANLKLFKHVDKNTVDKIWQLGKVVNYKKGAHCFKAKEQTVNVYVLLKGKVAIYNLTHNGKRKTIFYLGEGALLNDQILKDSVSSVSCESIDECYVFVIRKDLFLSLMSEDFSLVEAILGDYEHKMFRMGHQLKNTLGCFHLERKVGSKLWKLSRDFGVTDEKGIYIDIPLSITELADFVGAPRESTSRALKKLVEKELIQVDKKRIYVISPEKLAKFYKTGNID